MNSHVPPQQPAKIAPVVWIPALVFTSMLLLFMMWVFIHPPAGNQQPILRVLLSLVSSFAATFMTGTISVQMNAPKTKFGKLTISAAGGLAVFVVVFFYVMP